MKSSQLEMIRGQPINQIPARLLRALWLPLFLAGIAGGWAQQQLDLQIVPRFAGEPLVFDVATNVTPAGQSVTVTRLDFLLSEFALKREDGSWLELTNQYAYFSLRAGRTVCGLPDIPFAEYLALRFRVGLPREVNHAEFAAYAADHPLNPNLNGLHWSWLGGYVFLALEGQWRRAAEPLGYSFHLASDDRRMMVELPVVLNMTRGNTLKVSLDAARIFDGQHHIQLHEEATSTHSREGDPLAAQLQENVPGAFAVEEVVPAETITLVAGGPGMRLPADTKPFKLTFSTRLPRPALPADNPLTEEGVKLGRRLFHETRLSLNDSQSCASCHKPQGAFVDPGRALSLGAEGKPGRRNTMPLFNLAWKSAFFWDGRAASLRQQVIEPIKDPIEMHESLTNVVAKLATREDYPGLFRRAFGSEGITAERLALALEQFLITLISDDSKFDRVMRGKEEFTDEEQRGFELFHMEFEPAKGFRGADCFHCHGGRLFQNVAFANNGLDAEPHDLGLYLATGKPGDKGKFAVPALRNVELTGPYMHDGRFKTLEEVVDHYSNGVKSSPTLDPNLAKHRGRGVQLNDADKRALIAFLKTLTEEKFKPRHANTSDAGEAVSRKH